MTPDECRHEAVAILASGLRRLRDRVALAAHPAPVMPSHSAPGILPEAAEKSLEAVSDNPLSVHVG
jgi:hypothetical protein